MLRYPTLIFDKQRNYEWVPSLLIEQLPSLLLCGPSVRDGLATPSLVTLVLHRSDWQPLPAIELSFVGSQSDLSDECCAMKADVIVYSEQRGCSCGLLL